MTQIIADWTQFVDRTVNENINYNMDIDKSLTTTDYVYLSSFSELEEVPQKERGRSVSDFAIINGARRFLPAGTQNGKIPAGIYALRDLCRNTAIKTIYSDGQVGESSCLNNMVGICPSLTMKFPYEVSVNNAKFAFGNLETVTSRKGKVLYYVVSIGEYAYGKVDDNLQKKLENLYNNGNLKEGLTCSGRLFTVNGRTDFGKDFLSKQLPEFIYDGSKYVRETFVNFSSSTFPDGTRIKEGVNTIWVKVEPMRLRVVNKEEFEAGTRKIKFIANDVILGGIPFCPIEFSTFGSLWQNSLIRAFLNSANSDKLDHNPYKKLPLVWDFSQRGFLYEAFNMLREPTRVFIVPKYENEIADFAFKSCLGLEKIVLHSGVAQIGEQAFGDCKFNFAYRLKNDKSIVLSKKLPDKEEEVEEILDLRDFVKYFEDFDYEIVLSNLNPKNLIKLSKILKENDFPLPYKFIKEMEECGKLGELIQNSDFRFVASEPSLNLKNLKNFSQTQKINFYKFLYAFGCFSNEAITDGFGNKTKVLFAQKASTAVAQMLKMSILQVGQCDYFEAANLEKVKPNQEFLKFICSQTEKKFQNLQLLMDMEVEYPEIISEAMTNFSMVKALRTSIGANGNPITVPWRTALIKFYSIGKYSGVTPGNQDIAEVFARHAVPQETFDDASKLREFARSKKMRPHILNVALKEETILESIERIKNQTDLLLQDGKALIEELFAKQFTYEMLDKYDPRNAILGIYCSCCATISNVQYGRNIARASMTQDDVQNMVIRNAKNEIVAKGTLYVNNDGYGVFNDFEINHKFRENEIVTGRYSKTAGGKDEKERDLIFSAFMRGIKAFVKEYDKENPQKPIYMINVGDGINRLKSQIENYKFSKVNLHVPKEYGFNDAKYQQRVLYDRREEKGSKNRQK